MGGYLQKHSLLDARLREIALLQIGLSSGCIYEWAHHVRVALESGVTRQEIKAVLGGGESAGFRLEPVALNVMRAAREMYEGIEASAGLVEELKQALGNACLVELIVLIGFYAGLVRTLSSLGVDLEPDYIQHLEEFPLPAKEETKPL